MKKTFYLPSQHRLGYRPSRIISWSRLHKARAFATRKMAEDDYKGWSPDRLLERVKDLENQLKEAEKQLKLSKEALQTGPVSAATGGVSPRAPKPYDPSRYSTRHVAFKFAYLGQNYNGFEYHQKSVTPLETIEEVLWQALVKSRLVWPADGNMNQPCWDGFDYSKCGRTDKGVSAFGQVIGIRVRSNRPLPIRNNASVNLDSEPRGPGEAHAQVADPETDLVLDMPKDGSSDPGSYAKEKAFDDIRDEIPYVHILNNVLPPQIRVLAWCPAPPGFSARFSCKERRYRYFFTQPAFNPTPGNTGLNLGTSKNDEGLPRREGWLDIESMKAAAKKYEGLHDFRNFCKIDGGKQIENFQRRIFRSEIREVDALEEPAAYVTGSGFTETTAVAENAQHLSSRGGPKLYQFILHGSAFLWHQVRHMVAILFLIGQGLEPASVIDELLDVEKNPAKPNYEMADDAPLVLWDCIFPEATIDRPIESSKDELPWIWIGDPAYGEDRDKFGQRGVVESTWRLWRKHKIDEVLVGSLLNLAAEAGGLQISPEGVKRLGKGKPKTKVFFGEVSAKNKGAYVPVMQRSRNETPEVINANYRERKAASQQVALDPDD